ncbi:hypothetical protein [Bifidobacterium oedipodis]|uniref:ABC transporter permease n=1 Tax=Bifidobacterium oedipodis TaxID=2675322 RepID=A0A7Y0EPT4_9BIFI|nr:hypothetical protein [Bifidobacterium sp. DSM 109957]NMM94223.1 hypothetical protein [Bifidobacterium sp. DSM 109957]
MMPQWTIHTVIRQAWRSFASRIGFAAIAVCLIAMVSATCGYLEAGARQNALDEETQLTAAGQYVYRAQARDENGSGLIPAALCQKLNNVQGVKSAMGIGAYQTATVRKAPGEHITYVPVTGNPTPILDASQPLMQATTIGDSDESTNETIGDIIMDAALANRLGITDGTRLQITVGDQPQQLGEIVRVHTLDAQTRGFADSQLIWSQNAPIGMVGECVAEVTPGVDEHTARELIATGLDDGSGTIISISTLLERDPNTRSPLERFRTRNTRWLWAASGMVCWALLFIPLLFRRHEFALLRSVGAGSNPTALTFAVANMLPLLAGHIAGCGWMILVSLWIHRNPLTEPWLAAAFIGASLLTSIMLLMVGCTILARGSITRFIHNRL